MSIDQRIAKDHLKAIFSIKYPEAVKALYGKDPMKQRFAQVLYTGFKAGYEAAKAEQIKI